MRSDENFVLLADAYKYSHPQLFYPGTQSIYDYFESRGGRFKEVVFFGLQAIMEDYFEGNLFDKYDIDEAEDALGQIYQRKDVFDRKIWEKLLHKHNAALPVEIKAVPEGTVVPVSNLLATIESMDSDFFWLPGFMETMDSHMWYPSTVATLSREIKKIVLEYYLETCPDAIGQIEYVINDFAFRGVSTLQTAGMGAMAHLLNFRGSDTNIGSVYARRYYDAKEYYGRSIPATEHRITSMFGESGELEMLRHTLRVFPTGTVACVSDTYDIIRCCKDYWGGALKNEILARDGTLVVRLDSGDPLFTVLKVFEILLEKFGWTLNSKGYKVLPSQIRVIQSDGVDLDVIRSIFAALKVNGISAENLFFGIGGKLLQVMDRDTQKFAVKASFAMVNGKPLELQKRPMEMDAQGNYHSSFKTSKAGRLKLITTQDDDLGKIWKTVNQNKWPSIPDQLQTVFKNGVITKAYDYAEIRERVKIPEAIPVL